MRLTVSKAVLTILVLVSCADLSARRTFAYHTRATTVRLDVAYALHGKLWLRSLSAGAAWSVSTPLPVSGVSWSPDGTAIAFAGRQGVGVVALHGRSVKTVFSRRLRGYRFGGESPSWSSDSRYMAFSSMLQNYSLVDRWVWDRKTGRSRMLVRGVTADYYRPTWANHSDRLAVAIGQLYGKNDVLKNPIVEIIDVPSGHIKYLGKGMPGPWSPDDRFLGFEHLWVCGATGCILQQEIVPSSGGRAIPLNRRIHTWDVHERWAPEPNGYAYDRWLLDWHGRVMHRVPGTAMHEPADAGNLTGVEAWSPDGRWVAVHSLTGSSHVILTLVSASTLRSRRVYVSPGEAGFCHACMYAQYQVIWNHSSTAFAMVTPYTHDNFTVKDVNPSLLVYSLHRDGLAGTLSIGLKMSDPEASLLGWVNHDRQVLLYAHQGLYRYTPGQSRLVPLVRRFSTYPYETSFEYGPLVDLRP